MFESTIDILDGIFKGLIIGVVASAPMGPVGVLIVQRTLNKGRWYGFFTGIGAAVSDMLYAVLAAVGMGLLRPFFETHLMGDLTVQWLLQVVASLLLFCFGFWTYRTRPKTNIPKGRTGKKGTLIQNGVTGFFITLSNPIIVFLFLILFARFNFVTPDRFKLGVEFVSVMFGALGWWLGLTYLISKVRSKFNSDRIFKLNRTIGVVVMVVSLVMFFFTITGKTLY
ncbi:MAG: LysE family transporter [Bacteroidales bacterium]|nr:LysE family transporter [Candidatus Physcousia equi]